MRRGWRCRLADDLAHGLQVSLDLGRRHLGRSAVELRVLLRLAFALLPFHPLGPQLLEPVSCQRAEQVGLPPRLSCRQSAKADPHRAALSARKLARHPDLKQVNGA